jgi:hypothetical protein
MRFSIKGSVDFGWKKNSKKPILEQIKEKLIPSSEDHEGIGGTFDYDIGVDMNVDEFNAIRESHRKEVEALEADTDRTINSFKKIMSYVRSEIEPTIQAVCDGAKLYNKLDHELNMENSDLNVKLTLKRKSNAKLEEAEPSEPSEE